MKITSASSATGTIIADNDLAQISLGPPSVSERERENGSFNYTVTLSQALDEDVILTWTATAGDLSASVDDDLADGTGMVTIEAGRTQASFTIGIVDDELAEGDESFIVTLTAPDDLPDGVTIDPMAARSTATITDNETAEISIGDAVATEGSSIAFTVDSTNLASDGAVLDVTVESGTASLDDDLRLRNNSRRFTVSIFRGDKSVTFRVPVVDDAIVEGSESFTVTIAENPDIPLPGGAIITRATATGTITDNDDATVSISPTAPAQDEGGTFTFAVTLSAPVAEDVTVTWTAEGSGGNAAMVEGTLSDLAATQQPNGMVVFPANSAAGATREFTIATLDDIRVEGAETFEVTLSGDLPDDVEFGDGTATATINADANDTAPVSISPTAPAQDEGGTFTFTVTLSEPVAEDVTVTWTTAGSGGNAATVEGTLSDLAATQQPNGMVVFPANSAAGATREFTIATLDDIRVEGAETFEVTLSGALPGGVEFGDGTATATINADATDTATVTLSPLSPSVAEGGTFTFTATLSASVSSPVTVRWTAASGTAPGDATLEGAGSDLGTGQATGGTVTFPADSAANATQTFTIATANDTRVEGSETFTVTLGEDTEGGNDLPDGVEIGSDDEATATINADATDTATVSLSPLSPSVAEGGTFTFTATLSAPVSEPVTVRWTASIAATDTATLGDLQATTDTVTFAAGDNTDQTFTIRPVDDERFEADETFTVTLEVDTEGNNPLPAGITIGTANSSVATITNDDDPPPTVNISIANPVRPVAEQRFSSSGLRFPVTLSQALLEERTLNISYTPGTGEGGASLDDLRGDRPTTLTLPVNATTVDLDVFIFDDFADEADEETFTVTLSLSASPPADPLNRLNITTATATGTIVDDDNPPQESGDFAGSTFTIADATVTEGGTARFIVSIEPPNGGRIGGFLIGYAAGTAGLDDLGSTRPTSSGEIPPNTRSIAIEVPINDDLEEEENETFTVQIPINNATTIQATGTIIDNDGVPDAEVSIANAGVAENDGNAEFTVSLSRAVDNDVVLAVAYADGTASVTDDLGTLQDTVTIEDGQTEATLLVPVNNDGIVEGNETFTVTISEGTTALPDDVIIGTGNEATGTITNDDIGELTLAPAEVSAIEGGTFTYTVSLSAAADEDVTVRWTATAEATDTATVDDDLRATTGTVTFNANTNTDQTFTISPVNDTDDEANETFTVTLEVDTAGGNPLPDGVNISATEGAGTATIINDNSSAVSIDPTVVSTVEGNTFIFTVGATARVAEDIIVTWTVAAGAGDGAATLSGAGSDLVAGSVLTGTSVIPTSQTTAFTTIRIATLADDLVEVAETFTVTLTGDLPAGVKYGDATATATITDTDSAVVSIGAAEISEGGTLVFPVSLSAPVSRDITLTASTSNGTAVAGTAPLGDYTGITNGAITFPANSVADVMFEVQTTDDRIPESIRETLTVTLTGTDLPERVTLSSTASTATGTIVDNESVLVSIEDMQAAEGQDIAFPITFTVPLQLLTIVPMTVSTTSSSDSPTIDRQADLGNVPAGLEFINLDGTLSDSTTYTVQTRDDSVVEGNETFIVTLGQPSTEEEGSAPRVDRRRAIGTIIDSDTATVSLASTATATEGDDTITFTVTLDNPVAEAFSLAWTATDGTATRATDFEAQSGTVDIAALSREVTFTIDITDDEAFEEEETFTVALSGAPTGLVFIDADRITVDQTAATGTITDDDAISITIADAPTVTEADNANVEFTVTLSKAATSNLVLDVGYTAVTATPADDLGVDRPTTVRIASGDDSATITVPVTNDETVEGEETFTVTLSEDTDGNPLPAGVTIDVTEATGTIADDDTGFVTLDPPTLTAAENGTFAYTVKLSNPADEAVNITWTASRETSDTASVLDDLQQTTGTVTFDADTNTDQPFTIAVADDDLDEDNETFTVTLTATSTLPTGVSIPTATNTHRSVATITDNDDAPEVNVSIANESVAENVSTGTATFTAELSEAVNDDVVLAVAVTAGTGTNPVTLADDLGAPGDLPTTVTIDQGQTEATFTVPITDDGIVEGDETFLVTISEGTTALPDGVTIGTGAATGTIEDNDEGTVSLSPTRVTAAEDDGPFTYTVSLDAAADEDVTVRWTASIGPGDTATLGDLQTPRTGTVTFDANTSTDQTFTISPVDDGTEEEPETFTVTLGADIDNPLPTGVSIPAATASSTATITDSSLNMNIFADARWTIADADPVDEGGTARFEITIEPRVPSPGFELPVRYTADTATLDDLGKNRPETLSFNQGDTSVTLEVPIENDVFAEGEETFTVTIQLAERFGLSPITIQATGTINASDPLTPVTVDIADATPVVENGGNATFTVTLSEAVTSNVVLDVEVTAGTGTSPVSLADDLGDLPPSVMIAQGQIEASFTVPITNDNIVEGDETFNVTVSLPAENPPGFELSLGEATAVGTITEDDAGEVTLAPDETTADEGGSFAYIVSLSNPADEAVDITWTATREADQTATVATDLDATTGTVSFDAGSRVDQPFTIAVTNDDFIEPDETFTVTLTATNTLPTGITIPDATASSVATITDNDDPPEVSISIAPASAEEGDNIRFTVTLSDQLLAARTLNVGYTAGTGGTGASLGDLGGDRPTTLNLPIGVRTVNLDVPTVEDSDEEEDETFTVTLSLPDPPDNPMNTLAITTATATGTITDDDTPALVAPQITTQPTDQSVTVGENATFTVTATGTPTPTYQWRFDGSDIAGATSASYAISNAALTNAGDYTVVVTNTAGTVTSSAATLTVTAAAVAPQITTQPTDQSVTVGGSATFTVTATGTPTPTYQWRFEGSDIAGATSASYAISNAALTNAGDYTVVVTNTAGTVTSSAATLTVTAAAVAPQITTQPTDQSVTVGENATFTVAATGTPTPTYQWRLEGSDIAGATSASYTLSNAALTNAGDYTVVVTNTAGTVTSSAATLTVTPAAVAPQITTQPTDQSVTVGETATFTVAATGTPTPTYQWRLDGSDISGATSASYTLSNAALTNAGDYTVVVTNTAGTVTSSAATLTVTPAAVAPQITTQPTDQSVTVGENATFTVAATGTPTPTYQWRFEGSDISGATSASYTLSNAALTNAGDYTVVVTNTAGTVTSSAATLTVTAATAPDLTVDGVSVSSASVVEGASFTINATVNNEGDAASAATTLTYYRSTDATITTGDTSIGTDAVGALAASGSSTQDASVSIATAGTYHVGACVPTVSGETDTDNNCSTGVQVTVTAAAVAPQITTQPTDQSVTVGETATFTVAATGTPTPTYQWRFEGSDIAGATSASYTLSNAALTNAGDYTVVVTNTAGTVTSSAATLTVTPAAVAPQITTQPTDQSVTVGGSATFTVAATGTPTPTYQWRFEGSDISGATSASYTLSNAALTNAGDYTVVVTNTAGTVTSSAATLTVTPAPPATAPDLTVGSVSVSSASVVEGASFTINATVNNEGDAASAATTLTYYRSADATITTGDTSIATDPIGALAASGSSTQDASVSIATAGTYHVGACVPTVSGETDTDNNCSTGVQVTVTAAAVDAVINLSAVADVSEAANRLNFRVDLDPQIDEDVTVAWAVTGGTATAADFDQYASSGTVVISADQGNARIRFRPVDDDLVEDSETLELTISADDDTPLPDGVTIGTATATGTLTDNDEAVAPEITTQPTDQSVTVGGSATFTVTATGTPTPTYQWRFEGSDIAGATSASYTLSNAALTNAGDYTVVVTNTAGTVTSSAATLTVTPAAVAPQITTQPTDQSVTVGETATFTVTATGTPTPTYQWRFEGSDISGATSETYTLSNAALTNAGDYTVVVTNTAGTVTSSAATLTVTPAAVAPQITTQPTDQSVTVGENATFTVAATGTPTPTYQWRFEGSDISGATSASYTLSNAALTNAGDYTVVVTNTAGTVTSSAATLTVTPAAVAPQITTQPTDQSVTVGGSATFTVTATGTPTPTYQWRFEGSDISGATSASYTLSSAALTNAGDYTVVVTNTAGTVTSSAATLTVTAAAVAPQITTQPTDQSVTVGETATFTVTATGTPTPTYQWRFDGSDISGATSASYTLSNAALTNAGDYTVVVTNTAGTVTSTAATLTVTPAAVAPQITTQPTDQSVTVGGSATFTVTATGTPTPTYQWRFEGSDIAGATSASYAISNAALTNAGDYTVVVTNTAGTVTSSAATLTVTPAAVAPQITTQPTDQSVTVGGSATFTVAATGTPTPTYQWRFEGSDISGATSASYTLSNAALTNAGDYTVVVTNTAGTVTSSAATLTVTPAAVAPQITTQPTDQSVTVGGSATFTVAATGTPTPTYQWRFEGSDISGATSASYTLSNAALTNAGDYTVVVTNTAGTVTSSAATLTVTPAPPATAPDLTVGSVSVSSASVVEGASFTINATVNNEGDAASAATTLTYYRSADATITTGDTSIATDPIGALAASGSSTQDASVSIATAGTYHVGACVPTVSGETDTDNNCSTGVQVTVTAAAVDAVINLSAVADVSEAANRLNFRVDLDPQIDEDVTVAWAVTGGTATAADFDQYASSGTVVISADQGNARIRFRPVDDDLVEDSETLELTISADDDTPLPDGVTIGTATATGTLTDNDEAVAPEITTQPTDQSVTVGGSATFTVTATGTPTPTYQWRFEGSDIAGATSASYTLSNAALTNAGDYTVVVTNTAGTVTSSAATLTVTPAAVAPQITTQPTDQSVTVGETATFTVTATGTPTPTYQWRLEGSDISGATSETYTLSNAALTNAGDYTVVVTNTAGTVTSSAATLTVTAAAVAPQITTQPTDQSVTVGENATFTVTATGTPTPTYQWRFEGSDISGATSETYTLSNAALTNAGDYTVVVTNTAGTVTSSAATLTVTPAAVAPQITTQPTDQSVTVGENATFTVAATGTPTPTYQWRFEGSDIAGATSASYTLSNAALTNAGDYTVVVTNTAGTVTSSAATLTVTPAAVAPQITTQPADQSVTVGETATFTVAATGTPTPTYQWRFEGSDISGATSASYTLSSAALTNAGDYTVVVTNTAGTVTSSAATLTVTAAAVAPQITTQPTDQSVTVGETATFTVTATGTPTPTYQWRFDGSDISGATSASYTLSNAALTNAGDYTVVVTNTAGTVTSTAATLTVTPAAVAPQITTQPTDQSVTVGGSATFTVTATGTPTPTYQWRFEGSDIAGATSASYAISNAALTNAGDYTVVVTNTAGTVTSSAATLTVTPAAVAPQITTQPTDQSVTVGGSATFTVAATGTPTPTYQWRFEGSDISGATSASYTLSSAALTNAGDYTVVVTNTAGTVTSSAATLTVTPAAVAPQITTQPTDQSVTVGGSATFTVAATGTPTPTYQWRFEGSDISGATSASYTLSNAALTNAGDYTVVVTNTAGTVTSSAATLTVTPAPPATAPDLTVGSVSVSSASVVEGASFTINATVNNEGDAASAATTLTYYRSADATITTGDTSIATDPIGALAASGSSTQDASVSIATAGTYHVGACVPTVSGETDTDNNCSTGVQVTVTAAAVDAVINLSAVADVSEAANRLNFRVDLDPQIDEDVTVAWAVTGGTATAADFDQYASSGTVVISADQGNARIRFRPVDDDLVEDSETLELTISADDDTPLPDGVTIGTATATGTLTDNDEAVAPEITTQPTDQSVTVGGSATFTVTATGTPTPTYQWRFEGSDIAGATSASYTLSNAALTNAGDYTVVVTNTAGTVTSSAATLTVTPAAVAPQITTQPTDQSVTVGETATFTVTATGTPTPTYQWRLEGSDISGATSETYTLSNAALTNAGDYTVVVTNTAGTVTSSAATLTVTPAAVAPQITTQPTDQSVTVGENATFTVTATGTPTPTYQWRFEGSDISGATSASYTLSNAALTNAGDYTVVVTNTAGTVTSSAATLTVTPAAVAPQITTQPADQSVTVGETATFTVAATGTPTPTYQWRFEGSDISGATSASYTLSNAALTNAGDYTVVVTNTAGTVTSSAATLTVTAAAVAPQITTQPTDQSVTVGETATFTVTATGTPTPTYQWRFDGSDISGATSASYTLSNAALTNAGDYTVVVTNTAGTVTSTAATLTVTPAAVAPQITTQPTDQSVTVGGSATFTVTATGTPTPTYQWRFEGSDIAGATSASYAISNAALTNAGDYTVVVTNTAGTVTSSAATLTVTPAAVAPQITTQPTDQSVTVGGSATFTVAATGTPTPTYQWRFEGSDISGATSASYAISNAALTNAGDYTVVVTNTAGTVTSSAATLTVTPAAVAPQITTQPTDQSVTVGGSATFTVAATGTPTPTYQWRFEGSDIAGATSASYTLSSAALTNAGDYTVVVTNTAGTVTSSAATLTVTPAAVAPQITTQPTDQSVTVGGSATFTVAATGTPTPTYQWRFEGSDISGATSASYTLSNAALTDAGDYTVVVTNTAGTVTSSAATLTVTPAPPATAPDLTVGSVSVSSASVVEGASFTINATVNNEGDAASAATTLTYYRSADATITTGDTSIATDPIGALAASGSSTQDASVSIATAGTYHVGACVPTVSGETDTDNNCSTGVQVTVTAAAVDAVINLSAVADVSEAANRLNFRVDLDPQIDEDVTVAWAVTGGTATAADFDQYASSGTVVISADQGNARIRFRPVDDDLVEDSETLELTISADDDTPLPDGVTIGTATATGTLTDNDEAVAPQITTQPTDQSVTVGETATFTVTATGTPTPTYQWRLEGSDISGATSETYTLSNAALTNAGDYTVVVTNTAGTVTSSAATLTVTPAAVAPQITTQPADQSVTVGENATFTVAATGTPTPTYQWRFDGSDIAGATSASYTLSNAALTNAGDYTVVVTNTAGTVTSSAATLTVTPAAVAPQITTQPTDQSVTVGETATFTVTATGTPTPTYQWRFEGSDISGATSASYTLSNAALTNAGDYTVVVTNTAGTVTSSAATLTVTPAAVAPQITTQPTDRSVTVGETATFTVAATGTPTPTYQWRFEGSDISGATSASYTLSNAALTNAGDYTVVVTNTAGTVTSSAATLTVTPAAVAPQITTQPTDQSVTVGETATFTVAATGTPTPTYQWRFEGSDISGATSASYTLSNAALTNAGDYTVVVTNTAGTVTSSAATLTVTAAAVAPQITTQPTDQSVTVGENATFTVAATGTPTPTYQWRFEGSDIAGATSASYAISNAALTNAGDYTVVVTNTAGTVTSSAATLTVTPAAVAPQITTQPTDQSVTVGENATFTVAATGTPTPTYQWRFEGSDISGATSASYTLSNAALTNAGDYTVVVTNTAGTVTSTAATLTVTPAAVAPQITTQPADQSVTVGENATFTVAATGTPTPTYQWRFEGSDISGATSASYTLSNAALTNAGDYTVVVTNTAGTVTSSAATLTVTPAAVAPQITTQPTDQSVTVGENATFTVAATGTPTPTYQWRFEGSDIAGATSASYTLSNAALTNAGDYTVVVTNTAGTVTSSAATLTVNDEAAPPASRLSVLIEPRLIGAGTALRRHAGRFDRMTGTVVRNRLDGRAMKTLTASQDLGSGAVAVGGSFDQDRLDQGNWGAWIDGAWAGFDGKATGRQADIHGGVDYLAPNGAGLIGNWLIGALIGHEVADLDIGRATYRSRYTHVGVYGGARLWQHLLFDGAVSYGRATPDIALGDVSASHDANRITARGALTGDFGLQYGLWAGSVRIEPQLGLLYSRERLGAFTDSAGGVGQGETLELGRFSAGPRLTWDFDGGRLTGGARMQWDFLELEDGVDGRVSAAADIGVTLDLAPGVTLGVQGDVDGIGIGDGFGSLGGTVELGIRF